MTTQTPEAPAQVALGDQIAAAVASALPDALDNYFANNMPGFVIAMEKAREQVGNCKAFTGTVVAVAKEQSSTRGVITLNTGTERENKDSITKQPLPAGQEQIRTERTDNPGGKALAIKSRNLIGHKVVVWIEVESVPGKDFKVRVLRHIQDLGVDPSFTQS